jgi:hypothetical protein
MVVEPSGREPSALSVLKSVAIGPVARRALPATAAAAVAQEDAVAGTDTCHVRSHGLDDPGALVAEHDRRHLLGHTAFIVRSV